MFVIVFYNWLFSNFRNLTKKGTNCGGNTVEVIRQQLVRQNTDEFFEEDDFNQLETSRTSKTAQLGDDVEEGK